MGRTIKRVPLDFDWPLEIPWKGFMCPYHAQKCKPCDGSGYNPETKRINDDWYDFNDTGRKWCYAITQGEVQALIDGNRLLNFTHDWTADNGWVKKDPPYVPTADEVNAWAPKGMGHDSINHWICVEARAKRLGIWGKCKLCNGAGEIWHSDKIEKLYDEWEGYEPPTGTGYQLWETVSEGSPISPVFATKEEFAQYLKEQLGYSAEGIQRFLETEWAPSMVMKSNTDGSREIKQNIDGLVL